MTNLTETSSVGPRGFVMREKMQLYVVVSAENGEIDVIGVYVLKSTADRVVFENNKLKNGTSWVQETHLYKGTWKSFEKELDAR